MTEAKDDICDIIDRAIAYTETVMDARPEFSDLALDALRKMRESLAGSLPNHPAIARLDRYLERRE